MLPTPKNAPARRFGDAMAASSRKGSGMGTPSLKLNTYRWKLPEKWYQVARTLGKSPKKSSEIANTPPYLNSGCYIKFWGAQARYQTLCFGQSLIPADILNFAAVRTNSRTRFRRYARRGVRGRQHQSDRQCCRHIGDGRNDSVTIFGHKMHQLVAVSPDMLIGQFFCECHRQNAEMTPELHFAQWLSGRSWDAILSNVFVNYVYNILPLQYPTMSRQVGL